MTFNPANFLQTVSERLVTMIPSRVQQGMESSSSRFSRINIFSADNREPVHKATGKVAKCAMIAAVVFAAVAIAAIAATIALTASAICAAAIPLAVIVAIPAVLLGVVATGSLGLAVTALTVALISGAIWKLTNTAENRP